MNDDCIKRSDAIEALVFYVRRYYKDATLAGILRSILERVPAADVEPKRKWISVKPDKPKEDGKYIVLHYSQGRPIIEIMYYGIPMYLHDRHFYFYDSEWGDVVVGDVTHWLPLSALPEPPKGGIGW